jgi:hypothetical protein
MLYRLALPALIIACWAHNFASLRMYVCSPDRYFVCLSRYYRRSQWPCGLRRLASWDCGFESHRGHGCLSVVSVVCCLVEVSATGWSLVQRSLTDCGASLYVI